MGVTSINVLEHQTVQLPQRLDNDRLKQRLLRAGRTETGAAFRLDQKKRLVAAGLVGLICTPSVQIQILPKVYDALEGAEARGLEFLKATFPLALGGRFDLGAAYSSNSSGTLIDLVFEHFFQRMQEFVEWEFPRAYFDVAELRETVSGRVDLNSLASRLPGSVRGVMVRHAPLQRDNHTSRLCKSVVEEAEMHLRDGKLIWVARQLQSLLSDVKSLPLSVDLVERAQAEPQFADWDWLFTLAHLLLNRRSLNPWEAGISQGLGIVYRVEHLFEKAVRTALARGIERKFGGKVQKGKLGRLLHSADGRSFLTLRPDLTVHLGSEISVGDVKWKSLKGFTDPVPAEDDLYQLLTYCRALNASKCFLIYPLGAHHPEVVVERVYSAFAEEVTVVVMQVDILQLLQPDPQLRVAAENKFAEKVAKI